MNKIIIKEPTIYNNRIKYEYQVEGEWEKYFTEQRTSFIEYSDDISNMHESIAVVPFICNVLPMVWLCDATIEAPYVDKDFLDHVEDIKKGYEGMYPMFEFKGNIATNSYENQPVSNKHEAGAFFSGGVDAYTTLLRHLDEKPVLMTIWGADVKLSDKKGWNNVKNHINSVGEEFDLPVLYIKSDFREVLDEGKCSDFVKKSGDGYWHGFQSGISVISHAAPVAFIYGMQKAYIASSFSEDVKGTYTCASDPTIDNYVYYCKCKTVHDGYDMNRLEKVKYIVKQSETKNKRVSLRVCWESSGGKNCCHCEKCYRTILEVVAAGKNPNDYGFIWDDEHIKQCCYDMRHKIRSAQFNIDYFYPDIQKSIVENKACIIDFDKYQWLLDIDFSRFNEMQMKKLYYSVVGRGVRKIKRLLNFIFGKAGERG